MAIKAVIFDLDDTLLWDERSVAETFAAVCQEAEQACGVDAKYLEAAVRKEAQALYAAYETYPFAQNIGINPFEALWAKFEDDEHDPNFVKLREWAPDYRREAWTRGLQSLGFDNEELGEELAARFYEERRKRPYVYEETFEILDLLKSGSYRLALLTNGSPSLQREKLDGVPELKTYFDPVVISGEFGQGKPAPAIFEHVLAKLDVRAEEALMVGDKLATDIKGANLAGIHSVWINRKGVMNTEDIVPAFEIHHLLEIPEVIRNIV